MDSAEKKYLSIDDIIGAEDTEFAEVEAWGGVIRLGSLDAGTMLDFVASNENKAAQRNAGLRLLVNSLVDSNGKRIGTTQHIEALRKKHAGKINKVVEQILILNGLGDKPLDFNDRFRKAGNDAAQLAAIAKDMRSMADAIEAAGTDEKKLKAVAEGKYTAELKNGSSEAN